MFLGETIEQRQLHVLFGLTSISVILGVLCAGHATLAMCISVVGVVGVVGVLSPWNGLRLFMVYSVVHLWLTARLGVLPTYLDDGLYVALLVGAAMRVVWSRRAWLRLWRVRTYVALYGAYCVYQLASAVILASASALWGLREWVQYSMLPFLVLACVDDLQRARQAYSLLVRLSVGVGLLAIVGVLWPASGLAQVYTSGGGPDMLRAVSTTGNPNTLAYFVAMASLCHLPVIWSRWRSRDLLVPALALVVVLVSLSRSAFVLFPLFATLEWMLFGGVASQAHGSHMSRRMRHGAWRLLALAGLAVAAAALVLPLLQRIPDLRVTRLSVARLLDWRNVFGPRLALWGRLLSEWRSGVLFGSGVGSVTGRTGRAYVHQVIDSHWLKLLLEQGVVGVFLFVALGADLARRAWGLCRSRLFVIPGVAALAVMGFTAVAGLFSTIMDIYPINVFLWIGAGFVLFLDTRAGEESRDKDTHCYRGV